MMKYVLIIVVLVLVALAAGAGYFYFTNSNPFSQAQVDYQMPVVIEEEQATQPPSGDAEIDSMETEVNLLDVPSDSAEVSDEDLMGL